MHTISFLKSSLLNTEASRQERISRVLLQDRFWLVLKTLKVTEGGSKTPDSIEQDWATCLPARHAQFNHKSNIFGLPIRTFQGHSLPDRWSRATKTQGTRLVYVREYSLGMTCVPEIVEYRYPVIMFESCWYKNEHNDLTVAELCSAS